MFVIITPYGYVRKIGADNTFSVTANLGFAKVFSTYSEAENTLAYVVDNSYIVGVDNVLS